VSCEIDAEADAQAVTEALKSSSQFSGGAGLGGVDLNGRKVDVSFTKGTPQSKVALSVPEETANQLKCNQFAWLPVAGGLAALGTGLGLGLAFSGGSDSSGGPLAQEPPPATNPTPRPSGNQPSSPQSPQSPAQ